MTSRHKQILTNTTKDVNQSGRIGNNKEHAKSILTIKR